MLHAFPAASVEVFDLEHAGKSYRAFTLAALAAAGVPEAVRLAALKARRKAQVDAAAEALRLKLITPGAGQALEYQRAEAEARAALAAPGQATAAAYPMLAATIGIDLDPQTGAPAADVLGVARSIVAASAAWQTAGAAIRGARLSAKLVIDAAGSEAAVEAAVAAIDWPDRG